MRGMLLAAVFIVLCAPVALAQVSSANIQDDDGDDYHKAEVFVGYSHYRDSISDPEGFDGFNASVTGNVSRYLGLKFDLSGHYNSNAFADASVYNVLGGVQVKDNSKAARFKPFAHLLAGVARRKVSFNNLGEFSDTGFSAVAVGGLDIRVHKRVDVRAGQLDYNFTRFGGDSGHSFRFGIGLVFH